MGELGGAGGEGGRLAWGWVGLGMGIWVGGGGGEVLRFVEDDFGEPVFGGVGGRGVVQGLLGDLG